MVAEICNSLLYKGKKVQVLFRAEGRFNELGRFFILYLHFLFPYNAKSYKVLETLEE